MKLRAHELLSKALAACAVLLLASMFARAQEDRAPRISKVEPPSWWAGHTINPVRLLVRGKNLAGARVHTTNPAIQVSEVFVNRNGSYLFVSVTIAGTPKPGSYPLILETAAGRATIPF